jgi:hypothetical protein
MLLMIELLILLYAGTVVVSWCMIKLFARDIPTTYALIPLLNLVEPLNGGLRGIKRPEVTPEQQLDRGHNAGMPWQP